MYGRTDGLRYGWTDVQQLEGSDATLLIDRHLTVDVIKAVNDLCNDAASLITKRIVL